MLSFSRSSRNIIANWWWTVDKYLLAAVLFLLGWGLFLSMSASPAIAQRLHMATYYFSVRHAVYVCMAIGVILAISMMNLKTIRRLAILGYIGAILLVVLTFFYGMEIKGSRRWLRLGFQIQPSEFLKPTFIVVTAWLLEMQRRYANFKGFYISLGLCFCTCGLLLKQPDYGMTAVVFTIWMAQMFLSGVKMKPLILLGIAGVMCLAIAYFLLPHVQVRFAKLIAGLISGEPSYQVATSLEAFKNGGMFGVGVGEGIVKWHIPDAYTDFIFPVAAEEYGMLLCLTIVGAYALIVVRSLRLARNEDNMFLVLSICGLALSFGLQAFVNMASTMQIGPTKGMALPLISYGGSSLMGAAIGVGMLLALSRKNINAENKDEE